MINYLLTLLIAPIITGIVISLFDHWLDDRDDK
ncbi:MULTISPECIES: type I toxin-antitoxin system Fst family toxin [Latilactobacillus]|nr:MULTISPECIES: type I toxin-antitoxin system Fst family toxin [Latilactobacillus]MCP8856550.1 type I toxin-antitoxin system Fst family toxin [Latilactobacillus sakei]MCP8856578.1 type I toxin-antitoxin system Fst family toxin [Latilactobacillus sakei]MDG2983985.1 type I toxin-antitoxin system Fst family toxin [Latilactobacillus curvatus]